jgi:acyl carrier protein
MPLEDAVNIGFLNMKAAFDQAKASDQQTIHWAVNNPDKGGNAILEYIQIMQRYPGTVQSVRANDRVKKIMSLDNVNNPTKQEVFDTIKNLICENVSDVKRKDIDLYGLIIDDYGIDTLGFVEIKTALEAKYNIDISFDEENEVKTVSDLVALVMKKLGE